MPVTRVALVGHSMGGLIVRAAGAVAAEARRPWTDLVTDVVTLGTPHLGAPIARASGTAAAGLARLPETAAFGRILDWRSVGVHDLVAGLAEDVPAAAARALPAGRRHPEPPRRGTRSATCVGDLLVRPASAYGRDRHGRELFPGADVLHVGRTDHFGLLNHPEVHRALRDWLG